MCMLKWPTGVKDLPGLCPRLQVSIGVIFHFYGAGNHLICQTVFMRTLIETFQ